MVAIKGQISPFASPDKKSPDGDSERPSGVLDSPADFTGVSAEDCGTGQVVR